MLHDSVYAYLCTDNTGGLVITTSSLPEETLKFVIQKVKIIWFRLYCDVIVIFRCITRKYSNDINIWNIFKKTTFLVIKRCLC